MRHRDRTTALDLFPEHRDHAPAGAEDVAEADAQEPRPGSPGERLNGELRHALGGAHHAHRLHRLVGGDEHERLSAPAVGGFGQDLRAQNVGLDRLQRIPLHHRDVLVGGGMEHDVGTPGREGLLDSRRVPDVPEDRVQLEVGVALLEFALDVEQAPLVLLEQHEPRRRTRGDLLADLGPDRAPGAGHEHAPVAEVGPRRIQIQRDRLAAQ